MPATQFGVFHRSAAVPFFALPLLLAACGSGGGDGGPDTRCFGVAQVAGWSIHVTSSFADAGAFDSFNILLHADVNATGTAGPVQASNANPDGYAWYSGTPTGTLSAHDTVINSNPSPDDTTVGTATAYGPGPNAKVGPYLSVNLATCQATLGAILYSQVTEVSSVSGSLQDTIFAAYPFQPGLTIDSLAVANGWTVTAGKIPTVLPSASFGSTGEYRVGGLSAPYGTAASPPALDSATVSWTATPLASLPVAARTPTPAGFILLPNGALVRAPR
jgi:hypothetical protein